MSTPVSNDAPDPIATEILRNAFISAAEEMNAALIRSAYTPIIYEMKDCAVALLDEHHRVLGQSAGLAIFLGNLEVATEVTEQTFGRECWQPGDVWILNDSYIAGTHLNDVTVYAPIFFGDELVGFGASRAHWLDVGAKDPGNSMDSTSIYQEGLRIGPTKVVEEGKIRQDFVDLLARNSRLPQSTIGDLNAQIAVARTGERRMYSLIEKFGLQELRRHRDEIFRQTEQSDREAIGRIPDGIYRAGGYLDSDGITDDPLPVCVEVKIDGEQMSIDLDGSSPMAAGPVNCGLSQAVSACRVAFKILINPLDPVNGGNFRTLSVQVPKGSMFAAEEPAACGWYFSCLGLLMDLIVKALAPVLPDYAVGANYGDSNPLIFSGLDKDGSAFIDFECHAGGWGAWRGSDGENGLINHVNAGLKDLPIEVVETKYPLRIHHYGFRPDSGGPGEWRGGCGVIREYEITSDGVEAGVWFERSVEPAWGLFNGAPGRPPKVTINPGRENEQSLLKVNGLKLCEGDVVRCETAGGGGYGRPTDRSREAIASDLEDGFVTLEGARRDYGFDQTVNPVSVSAIAESEPKEQ